MAPSTAEIARAAGCAEAVLYRHFDSKQALFAAVVARSAGLMKGHLADALAAGGADPIGGMSRAASRHGRRPGGGRTTCACARSP